MRIQIIGRFHSRSFGPWSTFTFVHMRFIHFAPVYFVSSCVSEARHSLPKKKAGSQRRVIIMPAAGKNMRKFVSLWRHFPRRDQFNERTLWRNSFCRGFALYNYNHRDWETFFSYMSFLKCIVRYDTFWYSSAFFKCRGTKDWNNQVVLRL